MSGEFTDVAKSWLLDPAWQKVFKHTVDVFEDYVSYILVSFILQKVRYCLLTKLLHFSISWNFAGGMWSSVFVHTIINNFGNW